IIASNGNQVALNPNSLGMAREFQEKSIWFVTGNVSREMDRGEPPPAELKQLLESINKTKVVGGYATVDATHADIDVSFSCQNGDAAKKLADQAQGFWDMIKFRTGFGVIGGPMPKGLDAFFKEMLQSLKISTSSNQARLKARFSIQSLQTVMKTIQEQQ